MIRLRTILLYDFIYYILFVIVIFYCLLSINFDNNSNYVGSENEFYGYITSINEKYIEIKGEEKLLLNVDFDTSQFSLGDYVRVNGSLHNIINNTYFNLFNYRKYLYSKDIYWTVNVDEIILLKENNKFLYKIKNLIIDRINESKNKKYLYTFVLGDKSYMEKDIYNSYQKNGVVHLFAVSGMHVGLLTVVLLAFLKKLGFMELKRYIIVFFFLFIYMFLTNFSASVNRSAILFFFLFINSYFYLNIKPQNVLLFVACINLILDPFLLISIGFQFSYIITFFLIVNLKRISSINNYFIKIFYTSFLAFIISFPICIYNFYEFNFLSIFLNVIFIPFVSIIIFPLSILNLFFLFLDNIYFFLIAVLENISVFFAKFTFLQIQHSKVSILLIIIYYILIYILYKYNKYIYLILVFILIYLIPFLDNTFFITFFDVKQGDSLLIRYPNNKMNIVIDTGGIYYNDTSFVVTYTIPYLKSIGVKKIDYLIITHGDYDHIGESNILINNFEVRNIIINSNSINDLEKDLIELAKYKKINVIRLKDGRILNIIDNLYIVSFNSDYENNSSIVTYLEYDRKKVLLCGDIEEETEKKVIGTLNVKNIDILKIAHHGSITSSSDRFLYTTNPKYSIISVGKTNNFNHPNKLIVDKLNKMSKLNITSRDGSISYIIENGEIFIKTCPP